MAVATMEECVEDIERYLDTLTRYPEPVLALALRVNLAGLLRALLEENALSGSDVREFLKDLETEVFSR